MFVAKRHKITTIIQQQSHLNIGINCHNRWLANRLTVYRGICQCDGATVYRTVHSQTAICLHTGIPYNTAMIHPMSERQRCWRKAAYSRIVGVRAITVMTQDNGEVLFLSEQMLYAPAHFLRRRLASGEGIVSLAVRLSRCRAVCVSVCRAATACASH